MTSTEEQELEQAIRDILKAPMRSKVSTADIAVGMMSSTALSEKVIQLSQLVEGARIAGIHEGIDLAETNVVSVIKKYRDDKHLTELRETRKSTKAAFKQLHQSVDEGVSLKLTPVDKEPKDE